MNNILFDHILTFASLIVSSISILIAVVMVSDIKFRKNIKHENRKELAGKTFLCTLLFVIGFTLLIAGFISLYLLPQRA